MSRDDFSGKMLLIIITSIVFNLFIGTEASCKIPLSPEHGTLHLLGGSQVNSIVLYSCGNGWKLEGATSSKCLITGEWTFPPPKCISSQAVDIQHKSESSKSVNINENILYNITTRKPESKLVNSCKAPKHPENGIVTYTTLNVGSKLTFECEVGYHLQDTRPVYCTSDGEWSKADVKCIAKTCDLPNHPKNGQVTLESLTFRSKLKFKCDDGYLLKSDEPVFCKSDGTWSKTDVQCVAKTCHLPKRPKNGLVILTSLKFGSQLKFKCNDGYLLKSDEPVFCTSDGTWSKTDVQCVAKACDLPENPENGLVIFTSLNFGSQLKFKCDDGYLLMSDEQVFCTSDGTWSNTDVRCVAFAPTATHVGSTLPERKATSIRNEEQNPRTSSLTQENNCSCTYNSHDRKLSAEVNGLGLWNGDKVRKGDKMILRCYDPAKHLVLPNATSLSGTLELFCDICRIWEDSDLPSCEDVGSGPCVLSAVINGSVGYMERRRVSRYKTEDLFVEFQVGRIFKHDETAIFRCKDGFTPIQSLQSSEDLIRSDEVVTCKDGQWSQSLDCKSDSCYGEPPPMDNGYPVVNGRSHRYTIYYRCNKNYVKAKNGMVTCIYGQWIGHTPTCIDEICAGEPPEIPNGRYLIKSKDHNTEVVYKCDPGYEMRNHSIVQCLRGEWTGQPPDCYRVDEVTTPVSPKPKERVSIQLENCFCLFYPRSELLVAFVNGQRLENGGKVRKGDSALLYCRDSSLHLLWPNGMRTLDANMTCEVCEAWGPNELPSCEPIQSGDSFIVLNENVTVQPGGAVESRLGRNLKLECFSWNTNYPDWYASMELPLHSSTVRVEAQYTYYQTFIHIENVGQQHAGSYECSTRTPRLPYRSFRPTKLDLITGISVSDQIAPNTSASKESKSEVDCVCTYRGNWRLKALLNGEQIQRGTNITKGESIQLGCVEEGKRLVLPNGTMIMSESVTWTCYRCGAVRASEMPTCKEIHLPAATCPQLEITEGTTIKYTNRRIVGSTATFSCTVPFVLRGQSTLRCLQTGKWNYLQPFCHKPEILCPPIRETEDISIHFTNSRKINSTAHFRCKDDNFKIADGLDTRTCLPSGEWSGANPDCEAPGCLIGDFADTAPRNLLPSMEGVTEELQPVGSELSMDCDKGWVLIYGKAATCGPHGTWDFGKAQCVLGCHLNDEEFEVMIEPVKEYYRFGESITMSCPNGFTLTSDVERVVCIGTEWSDTIPNCREIRKDWDYYE